jgi:hypothetical protein
MSCQKQICPISFVFTECQYVTIIIKPPKEFPLEIIRIPIDNVKTYSRQDNNQCFEFVIKGIQKTHIKINKHITFNIDFILDNEIKMVYSINTPDQNPTTETFHAIMTPDISVINDVFNYIDGFNSPEDYMFQLFNIPILVLKMVENNANIHLTFRHSKNKSNNYIDFDVKEECAKYVSRSIISKSEEHLFSRADSLIWRELSDYINYEGNVVSLKLLSCCPMFKHSLNKSLNSSDNVYYLMGYLNNHFVFIKVISKILIKTIITKEVKYSDLFDNDMQILEVYLLEYVENV